jgi:hypothetical protein
MPAAAGSGGGTGGIGGTAIRHSQPTVCDSSQIIPDTTVATISASSSLRELWPIARFAQQASMTEKQTSRSVGNPRYSHSDVNVRTRMRRKL